MAFTETRYQIIGCDNPNGMKIGQSATDLIGLYGVTPVAQHATIADVATSTITTAVTTTTGNCWGFATSTQGADVLAIVADMRTKLNTLLSDLEDTGLHATA